MRSIRAVQLLAFAATLDTTIGQAVDSLPACGQTCISQVEAQFASFDCAQGNLGCMCANEDFGFGIRDCAVSACGAAEASTVTSAASALCATATLPVSSLTSTSATPAAETPKPSTTPGAEVVAPPPSTSTFFVTETRRPTQPTSSPSTTTASGNSTGENTSNTTNSEKASSSSGLSVGAKAGIGIGAAAGAGAIIAGAVFVWVRSRQRQQVNERGLRIGSDSGLRGGSPLKISEPLPGSGRSYANDHHHSHFETGLSELEMKSRRYEDMVPRHMPRNVI